MVIGPVLQLERYCCHYQYLPHQIRNWRPNQARQGRCCWECRNWN